MAVPWIAVFRGAAALFRSQSILSLFGINVGLAVVWIVRMAYDKKASLSCEEMSLECRWTGVVGVIVCRTGRWCDIQGLPGRIIPVSDIKNMLNSCLKAEKGAKKFG